MLVMAFLKVAIVLVFALEVSMVLGAVYKVGDSTGWTTLVKYDYKKWAAEKTFRVGDTIGFEYNAEYHNVMLVTHTDYNSCNTSSPIKTWTTGNDSITIMKEGHYYYLCGIPGHCLQGQKVDIRVAKLTSSPAPEMSPTSATSAMVPVASPKGAANLACSNRGELLGIASILLLSFWAF